MKTFKKAILFQNGGIGDFLMALFLAEQLKKYGGAEKIYIIVHRVGEFLRGFMDGYPYISLIEVSGKRPLSFVQIFKLFGRDNVVILPPTIGKFQLRLKFLARVLALPPGGFLVGFQDSGILCSALYSKVLPYNINQLFIETMRDILRALKIESAEKTPRLIIEPSPKIVDSLNLSNKRYIFFHPFASAPRRCFSQEDAIDLANFILSMPREHYAVISGAEHERERIEKIIKRSKNPGRLIAVIGASPQELSALIEKAELFIGVDTGITHMACFLGKRALVVAQNATPHWFPYYNKEAKILYRFKEDEKVESSEEYLMSHQNRRLRPLKDIPIEIVCDELGKMLGKE